MRVRVNSERKGRLTRVGYDNSARGNNFDEAGLRSLVDALADAAAAPDCSVIRLAMAGANFSGGWDTTAFGNLSQASATEVAEQLAASQSLVDSIASLPVPVVTSVHGKVIGFAAGLLDAIHLAVAADTATLHLPEARFGFAPAGVGHRLTQALPRKAVYPLLLGCAAATAEDLLRWGFVSAVVPAQETDERVDALAHSIAELPGQVSRAVLDVVRSSLETGGPGTAFNISAATIVAMAAESGEAGTR
ncbi:MAG: enoyl-CoA hydratase/isomerase family protein [Nocardioidaceae bacterium]